MLSQHMLRVLLDDREREVQAHLRVHQLTGGRRGAVRRHGPANEQPSRHPTAEGRVR